MVSLNLEEQLKALQEQQRQLMLSLSPQLTNANVILEEMIQKKILEMFPNLTTTASQTIKEDASVDLLASIGAALNDSEKEWISNNFEDASKFLLTDSGKAITRRFYMSYKEYKEQQ